MKMNRRDFVKTNAAAATAVAAGMTLPATLKEAKAADDGIRWDKGACRFCGTGWSAPRMAAWWPPRVTRTHQSTRA